jgi:G:T/U-mismatch repair DNA glycosylase
MAVEEIILNGKKVKTLRALLRPGLRAIFVGLNPSRKSVEKGHYYQVQHGRCFWSQLRKHGILPLLPLAEEDDGAFVLGYGFADLIRRPTLSGKDLTTAEKSAAVADLIARLGVTRDRPLIVFRYKELCTLAEAFLTQLGYRVLAMPSPSVKKARSEEMMRNLRAGLRID